MTERNFFKTALLAFFCFGLSPLLATHLVGGDISYTCLGGNIYEIRLRIYRDCTSGTQFDANASIAIFDQAGTRLQTILPPKGPTIPVPSNATGNPCVTAPPGLCVEYAEYFDTLSLPPIAGGYTITHQRCCRNTLDNVVNSGDKGNTYTVTIPDSDLMCNSSPRITSVAPIVLCLNENINLPISVSEPDGDSLHFELCDILNGGADNNASPDPCLRIVPNPPCAPPYMALAFTPPFTSGNPIPSAPQFSIDPLSGVLTGMPVQQGIFAVGICVNEWRGGVLLSKVRLDYQFTVTNCIVNVVSDMVTPAEDPQILCNGLSVNFTSESKKATSLLWDFGDPASVTDTSSSLTPTYTYSAPGRYIVTLIANPGLLCGDTIKVSFDVKNAVVPSYSVSGAFCFEAQDVRFQPVGTYPPNATYRWNFGPGANFPVIDAEIPPSINWDTPGKHYVEFTVTRGACAFTSRDSLTINELTVAVDAGPDQVIAKDEVTSVTATGGVEYSWTASDAVYFGNPFGRHTTLRLREDADTVKLYVRVKDRMGCEGLDSLFIYVNDGDGPINFFSPNDDGLNDVFDISGLTSDEGCRLTVMNRWGSTVYQVDDYQNDWRGTNQEGNPLPDGTYYYILQCGQKVRHQDAVTILRSGN